MDTGTILTGFGLAVAILAGLAAVAAYLRGTAIKADMDRLRQANDDLRADVEDRDRRVGDRDLRIAALEKDVANKEAGMRRMGDEIEDHKRQLREVWEHATGIAELRDMAELLRHHDAEAAHRHAAVIKALRSFRVSLEGRSDPTVDPPRVEN